MSSMKKISASLALAIACAATVVNAAPVLTIIPEYAGTYDENFNTFTQKDLSNTAFSGSAWIHQIDVKFTISGLAADEDFGGMSFNIDGIGAGLADSLGLGWNVPAEPEQVTLRVAPTVVRAPLFYENKDSGASGTDFKSIVVFADSKVAYRANPGEDGRPSSNPNSQGQPTFIGSLFVVWDGTTTKLTASPAPGASLNVFMANEDVAAKGATAHAPTDPTDAYPDYVFMTGEVNFGGSVIGDPTYIAAVNGAPVDGAQSISFTGNGLYQAPVEIAGGPKDVFDVNFVQTGANSDTGNNDLYVMYWLNGEPEDIAALKAQFEAEATGGTLLADGPMYAELMRVYPTAGMILQYPGMADILDGGSLSVDFSNTGVTVSAIAAVPEPASLLSLGALGVLGMLRRRR